MAEDTRKDRDKQYSPVSTSEPEDDLELPSAREPKGERCGCLKTSGKSPLICLSLIMIIVIVVVVTVAVLYTSGRDKSPVVRIDCFEVQGERKVVSDKEVFVFKGIPYAEPPVGELRWKPPVPIENGSARCDNSTFVANKFGNMCYQGDLLNVSIHKGSEDCLYLNVWTPTTSQTAKLPVMVWIHGGYLLSMDGNTDTYCPNEELTSDTNMVYVSMNYRLNAFGFMALDLLSEETESKTSGNYGFRDQIAALEWVKRNIAVFGGDPDKVTIFGQSSGGTSVLALLASPMAKGLFHAAWTMSGSTVFKSTLSEANESNQKFLTNTGCSNTTCLRSLSPTDVLNAIPWHEYPYWAMADLFDLPVKGVFDGPLAIVDGEVIPYVPLTAWRKKEEVINSPVIIGVTAQEVDLWPAQPDVKTWNATRYENYVKSKLDTFGNDISNQALKLYEFTNDTTPEYLLTTMTSDARLICATDTLADAMVATPDGPTVYKYVTTARPTSVVSYLGIPFSPEYSFHCIDSFAFFGTMKKYYQLKESDSAFQSVIRKEILSFASTGKVSSAAWKKYPEVTAILETTLKTVPKYHEEQCDFWLTNGFFAYSWIN